MRPAGGPWATRFKPSSSTRLGDEQSAPVEHQVFSIRLLARPLGSASRTVRHPDRDLPDRRAGRGSAVRGSLHAARQRVRRSAPLRATFASFGPLSQPVHQRERPAHRCTCRPGRATTTRATARCGSRRGSRSPATTPCFAYSARVGFALSYRSLTEAVRAQSARQRDHGRRRGRPSGGVGNELVIGPEFFGSSVVDLYGDSIFKRRATPIKKASSARTTPVSRTFALAHGAGPRKSRRDGARRSHPCVRERGVDHGLRHRPRPRSQRGSRTTRTRARTSRA